MKKFKILLDFLGSQDGMSVTEFKAGDVVEISDHLAPHIGDWAEEVVETLAVDEPAETQATPAVSRPQIKIGKRDSR